MKLLARAFTIKVKSAKVLSKGFSNKMRNRAKKTQQQQENENEKKTPDLLWKL